MQELIQSETWLFNTPYITCVIVYGEVQFTSLFFSTGMIYVVWSETNMWKCFQCWCCIFLNKSICSQAALNFFPDLIDICGVIKECSVYFRSDQMDVAAASSNHINSVFHMNVSLLLPVFLSSRYQWHNNRYSLDCHVICAPTTHNTHASNLPNMCLESNRKHRNCDLNWYLKYLNNPHINGDTMVYRQIWRTIEPILPFTFFTDYLIQDHKRGLEPIPARQRVRDRSS